MKRIVVVLVVVGLLSVIFVGTAIASVTGAGPSISSAAIAFGAPQALMMATTTGAVAGVQSLPSTSTADATWALIVLGIVAAAVSFELVRRRISA